MLIHKPVALALLFALGAAVHTGCSSRDGSANGQTEHAKVPELTVDEVETRISKNDASFFVFDVNPKEVFDAGRVPGAKWIEKVKAELLPTDKEATLVFYCANDH
jgi:hypothetical protein